MDFRKICFGVEVELTGISRSKVSTVIANYFNTQSIYEGGSYDAFSVEDNNSRKWQVVRDGSVKTEKKVNGTIISAGPENSIEIVTPILKYEDIESLQEIMRQLRKVGCFPNYTTGIHIHVGLNYEIEAKKISNLLKLFYSKQDLIYKAINVGDYRRRYCEKLSEEFTNKLNNEKKLTMDRIRDIWYEGYERGGRYNRSRYKGINPHPILSGRMPTVEYRMFQFSRGIHAGELKSFIQFTLAFTAYALNAKSISMKKTVPSTGNSKYTFRVFLLKLGFIGNEFATARQILLKNLVGNIAWRDRV